MTKKQLACDLDLEEVQERQASLPVGEEPGGSSWHMCLLFPLFYYVFSFKSLTQGFREGSSCDESAV